MQTEVIKDIIESAIEELVLCARYYDLFEVELVDDLSLIYVAFLFRDMGWVVEYNKTSTGLCWSFGITHQGLDDEE